MKKIIWVITFFYIINGYPNCLVNSPNELLTLVKENHPTILKNNFKEKYTEKGLEVARQILNPELDVETSTGNSLSGNVYQTSVSLKQPFEIGGKKNARIGVANAEINLNKYQSLDEKENVIISTVLSLHKLRQIHELIPIYEESLNSFGKILKKLENNKSLSPSQEVEQETLKWAINNYKLQLSFLLAEKVRLNKHLSFFMNKDCEISRNALPFNPIFSDTIIKSEINEYSKLKLALSDLEVAKSELEYERSLAIPNVSIGPVFAYGNENFDRTISFGIGLTMDIPIFNRNNGGKSKAFEKINLKTKTLAFEEREAHLDLDSWKAKYLRLISVLNTIVDREELEKKHQKIEAYYKRGIIQTSLVIESHRQLIEFTNSRFETELEALEAIWNIYKINGAIDNSKI